MNNNVRIMMLGDISGSGGMGALFLGLSSIIREKNVDFVIANGENASAGFGISPDDYYAMKKLGINVITSGNHIWQKEDIFSIMEKNDDILRPCNYPEPCVGSGYTVKSCLGREIAVINLQGRINMMPIDDPFRKADAVLREIRKKTPFIFVDFHAEAADEKEALGFYLDGRVTAVVGTHTHVQTADEKILPNGTAYISDLGLTGVQHQVIGSRPDKAIERQFTQLPIKSEVAEGKASIQGVIIEADEKGKALSIERFTY